MRTIAKGREPSFLTLQRATPSASFDALSASQKDAIRTRLSKEQGRICAYCMARIDPAEIRDGRPTMRVEHWTPQSREPGRTLLWSNLLGSCDGGGDGAPPSSQSCDRAKAGETLTLHPAACPPGLPESTFRYLGDGGVDADPPYADDVAILNLNADRLKTARAAVIDAVIFHARQHTADPASLRRIRKTWAAQSAGRLRPFVQVALYLLDRRIRAAEAKRAAISRRP